MSFFKFSIAVSGTHGKSTSSSMVSEIFLTENLSPTSIIGADAPHSDHGFINGKDRYFIAEACEYKNGILHLNPFSALILNIEYEHPDFFKSMEEEVSSFKKFAENIDPLGFLVINKSCDLEFNISSHAKCKVFTFDTQIEINPDFYPLNIEEKGGFFSFDMYFKDICLGKISLSVPGLHNVSNALAAGALAYLLGIEPSSICNALSSFSGVKRRLEYKGLLNGAEIYEDYAHHPTEISASLNTLRKMTGKKIVCVFQPHTYSRTLALFKDFAKALSLADLILLAPIYGGREKIHR